MEAAICFGPVTFVDLECSSLPELPWLAEISKDRIIFHFMFLVVFAGHADTVTGARGCTTDPLSAPPCCCPTCTRTLP
jgi:hypothetical protein